MPTKRSSALPGRADGLQSDDDTGLGRSALGAIWSRLLEFIGAALLYLACELLVWGLSQVFRPTEIRFPASVIAMIVIFAIMCSLQVVWYGAEGVYDRWIKPKVSIINSNIGVGFPVPMIMVGKGRTLDATGIGKVIATFVNTNIVFWSLIFAISWVVLAGMLRIQEAALESVDVERQLVSLPWTPSLGRPPVLNIPEHLPAISMRLSSWRSSETTMVSGDTSARTTLAGTPAPQDLQSSVESLSYPRAYKKIKKSAETTTAKPTATCPELATGNYPVFLSLFFALAIGFPVAAKAGDDRILDGCVLWFVWASTVQFQRVFKTIALMNGFPKTKSVLVTLLNPVAWTTIGMIAYTRAKAGVVGDLDGVLAVFSSGTSLSDLWNAHVARIPLRRSQPDWFGAGDAALSVLESGIVAWGFKLFECRRELWSRAGAVVVLLSSLSAIMSVFVSVLLGRGVGLGQVESLAFAARSTTLALARPAMQAIGASEVVNAAIVVCNGILGQLMYPCALRILGIPDCRSVGDPGAAPDVEDSAITIAAGTTIGINGAAMGVSYLYERGSRAAPYAALSMTVFGVMTVVFTSVEPFNHILRDLTTI